MPSSQGSTTKSMEDMDKEGTRTSYDIPKVEQDIKPVPIFNFKYIKQEVDEGAQASQVDIFHSYEKMFVVPMTSNLQQPVILNPTYGPAPDGYRCDQCSQQFHSWINLERHIVTHLGLENVQYTHKKSTMITRSCSLDDIFQSFDDRSGQSDKHLRYKSRVKKVSSGSSRNTFMANSTKYLKQSERSSAGNPPAGYRCVQCNQRFKLWRSVKRHMLIHLQIKQRPGRCVQCNQHFKDWRYVKEHIPIHLQINNFECRICGKKFLEKFRLTDHAILHTDERPYACNMCSYKSKRLGDLNKHKKFVHKENNSSSGEVAKTFECPMCLKQFSRKAFLTRHKVTHNKERTFQCDICLVWFKHKITLGVHKRAKHRKNNQKKKQSTAQTCDICGLILANKNTLKVHKRSVHFKERPFCCPICGKSFRSNSAWYYCMKAHSNPTPFQCDQCDVKYSRKQSLKQHMASKHPTYTSNEYVKNNK